MSGNLVNNMDQYEEMLAHLKMADRELDMVADMEMDMVADIDMEIQFVLRELVTGAGHWLIRPKLFRPEAIPGLPIF